MPTTTGPPASLASSAFRLDCPFPLPPTSSVDRNAEACPNHHRSFSQPSPFLPFQRATCRLNVSSNVSDVRASGVERVTRSSFLTFREVPLRECFPGLNTVVCSLLKVV